MSARLLQQKDLILQQMVVDSSLSWLMKRILVIHLKILPNNTSDSIIECLDGFTENIDVLSYLISKGNIVIVGTLFLSSIPLMW